jgi:hypothetical protein
MHFNVLLQIQHPQVNPNCNKLVSGTHLRVWGRNANKNMGAEK